MNSLFLFPKDRRGYQNEILMIGESLVLVGLLFLFLTSSWQTCGVILFTIGTIATVMGVKNDPRRFAEKTRQQEGKEKPQN